MDMWSLGIVGVELTSNYRPNGPVQSQSQVDELLDRAVGGAGQVRQHGAAARLLVQPLEGHDREHLADGPGVREGLEHRHVQEHRVREGLLEIVEVLGREVVQAVQRDLFADERLLQRPPVGDIFIGKGYA